jgi:hypothetical protein
MDGTTVMQQPLDSIPEVVRFVKELQSLKGYHGRVAKHALGFTKLYGMKLTKMQMILALGAGMLICAQPLTTSLKGLGWIKTRPKERTFISTTEPLDHMYTPAFRISSRFAKHFKPTMVTNQRGELHEDILNSGLLKTAAVRAANA